MQTIAVISKKGGSGKTTLAVHLAVAAVLDKQNVAIIDLDPQASAAEWGDYREAELPVVRSAHAKRLRQEIEQEEDAGRQLLILDTAPHADSAVLEAAKFADIVLVPCRPAIFDMRTIAGTLDLVHTQTTPVYVVMNAVAPQGQEAEEAAKAIAKLNTPVCPIKLVNRIAFSRSLVTGQSAQEFEPDGRASEEIKKLYAFVRKHLKASPNK